MPGEGGGMPKHVAKGQLIGRMGGRYNARNTAGQREAAIDALVKMRQGVHLADVGSVQYRQSQEHFKVHWLGETVPGVPPSNTLAPLWPLLRRIDPGLPPNAPNYWWHGWIGNPEPTLRQGLIRTIEVALGLPHDGETNPQNINPTRDRRVEIFWICGLPRFEMFITWNDHQVTTMILTPGFSAQPGSFANLDWLKVDDFLDETGPVADSYTTKPEGILFVGQNTDRVASVLGFEYVVMDDVPPVVVNAITDARGGIG